MFFKTIVGEYQKLSKEENVMTVKGDTKEMTVTEKLLKCLKML
jgi:hypothetical protein